MILTDEQILQGVTIEHLDICSLFPYVQWEYLYTINPHLTVTADRAKLDRLVQNVAELRRLLSINFGACYCKVLPPQQLDIAVLPYRARNKSVYALCRKCAEQDTNEECNHNEDERELEGIYVFHDLFKAIQRGYRVRHIFEVSAHLKTKCIIYI